MPDQTADELRELRDELRGLVREAHGTLKDLRSEMKTARELVPLLTDEAFNAEVKKRVDALGKVTEKAMDDAVAAVFAKFDKLRDMLMAEDPQSRRKGRQPLPAALQAYIAREADRE
ncbi:hypothetical protein ACFWBR_42385 [Streptomyces sp. NPDC060006]|uniref:hypothetical protein n=1 Tax=unclassified Streptomyces TaxID=2593676 RepID=UPI0036B8B6D0